MSAKPSPSLFIGDLAVTSNETDLHEKFAPFGNIQSVRIMRTRKQLSLGYAFVAFDSCASAIIAMAELNGKDLCGRNMRIAFATVPGNHAEIVRTTITKNQSNKSASRSTGSLPTTLTGGHSLHAQRQAQLDSKGEVECLNADAERSCTLRLTFFIARTSPAYSSVLVSAQAVVSLYNYYCQGSSTNHRASGTSHPKVIGASLVPVFDTVDGAFGGGTLYFVDKKAAAFALRHCSIIFHMDVQYGLSALGSVPPPELPAQRKPQPLWQPPRAPTRSPVVVPAGSQREHGLGHAHGHLPVDAPFGDGHGYWHGETSLHQRDPVGHLRGSPGMPYGYHHTQGAVRPSTSTHLQDPMRHMAGYDNRSGTLPYSIGEQPVNPFALPAVDGEAPALVGAGSAVQGGDQGVSQDADWQEFLKWSAGRHADADADTDADKR